MAEIVEPMSSKRGRPALYPWDQWTDGRTWRLSHPEDVKSSVVSFRTQAHRWARAHRMKARTFIEDDTITVQFYKPE